MVKHNPLQQAARWGVKNWEILGDFHYLVEFAGAFSPNNPQGKVIARRYRADLSALWDHAQRALLTALLRKYRAQPAAETVRGHVLVIELLRRYAPATRARILDALRDYFDELELHYLRWVRKSPDRDVKEFLAQAPVFTLSTRGGPRKKARDERRIEEAALYFQALKLFLKQKLKKAYHNPLVRERDVRAALRDALGSLDEVPQRQLNRWRDLPLAQLALEVAAWKYKMGPVYLEKVAPHSFTRRMLPFFADLRGALILPVVQDIHQQLHDLRAAVLDAV